MRATLILLIFGFVPFPEAPSDDSGELMILEALKVSSSPPLVKHLRGTYLDCQSPFSPIPIPSAVVFASG